MPDLKQRIGSWLGFGMMADAARPLTRERSYLPASAADSRSDIDAFDRLRLLALSRRLFINNPIIRAAVHDMARYSVGPGIRPQARSGDAAWDRAAEEYFQTFAEAADIRGLLDFYQIQSLASLAIDRDGDVFLILTTTKDGRPAVQVVEAHRCGTPQGADQKAITDGVQADATGRPLKYHFTSDRDGKIYQPIAADSVVHLFEPDRPDQFRGYPRTAVALIPMLDRDEVLRMEMQGVKAATSLGMVITNNTGSAQGGFFGTPTHNTGDAVTSETIYSGGGIARLKPGESVQTFSLSRPNEKLDAFLDQYIRAAAIGMGLPYEFIWNSERLAGTAQRFTLAKAQRRFEERQRLLIHGMCNRVWRYVIAYGIQTGELPRSESWKNVVWQTPRKLTVDAGRESQAIREEYKLGFTNLADVIGAEGSDWQEVVNQKISESKWIRQRCEEEGIDPASIQLLTPNGNIAAIPAAQPLPDIDSDQATPAEVADPNMADIAGVSLNGAQVAALLEIMASVARGIVTREGAISIITSAFPAITEPMARRIIAGVNIGSIDAAAPAPAMSMPETTVTLSTPAPCKPAVVLDPAPAPVPATAAFTMPDTPDYTLTKKEENMILRAIGLMPKPRKSKKPAQA